MNIIIAGGGTGGHLFPGIAIAQEFLMRSSDHKITFIGIKKGIESRILPKLKLRLNVISIKGFKGKNIFEKIISVLSIPFSVMQSAYYLKMSRADIIIGLGGYISFPALAAGFAMGIPTVIHEQNSIPGLSNRILGRFVKKVFISFEESSRFFQQHKTVVSGMPVRCHLQKESPQRKNEEFCIFIIGGSQGSREINHAVIESLPLLIGLREKIRFIHQSGKTDMEVLKENYKKLGFNSMVHVFIEDVFSCYNKAHLVIARAGASTLAELALCSKAAILIPYPFAAGNHQVMNANVFVDRGAALMIRSHELSGSHLSSKIIALEKDRKRLQQMESKAKTLAEPNASETIVDVCCQMAAK